MTPSIQRRLHLVIPSVGTHLRLLRVYTVPGSLRETPRDTEQPDRGTNLSEKLCSPQTILGTYARRVRNRAACGRASSRTHQRTTIPLEENLRRVVKDRHE
jgi:hypothetical protein